MLTEGLDSARREVPQIMQVRPFKLRIFFSFKIEKEREKRIIITKNILY